MTHSLSNEALTSSWPLSNHPVETAWIAALGRQALIAEAELTPKPGLVDRRGGGAGRPRREVAALLRGARGEAEGRPDLRPPRSLVSARRWGLRRKRLAGVLQDAVPDLHAHELLVEAVRNPHRHVLFREERVEC